MPKYTFGNHGVSDLVAGITVGLTVIPQAIAFANVAGLPPQVSASAAAISRTIRVVRRVVFAVRNDNRRRRLATILTGIRAYFVVIIYIYIYPSRLYENLTLDYYLVA